ncbi:MAG: YoaP domain-containing protein [Bacteroidetes bacterium]|nr:YoaP domain-containing protein [Bacteroidota bacterium]
MDEIQIISVIAGNVNETGTYCIKDKKAPGHKAKVKWVKSKGNEGLRMRMAIDNAGRQLGFIEFTPAEFAWRPVIALNYLFIHCIAILHKEERNKNVGSSLIGSCEKDARKEKKSGVCVMTSSGAWMADKRLFEKNGYIKADELDRFELMFRKFDEKNPVPRLIDWREQQNKYQGWNLVYADQCPWHEKSVNDLKQVADEWGIDLKVIKLRTSKEAQDAPSGFGTYSLIRDGRLLDDHYISKTRFESILRKELKKTR